MPTRQEEERDKCIFQCTTYPLVLGVCCLLLANAIDPSDSDPNKFRIAGIVLLTYSGLLVACCIITTCGPVIKAGLNCMCSFFCQLQTRRARAAATITINFPPNPIQGQIAMPGGTGDGGIVTVNPMHGLRSSTGEP